MSSEGKSAARSDAEKCVIEITTEAGDPVTYSGNPAELPGARFETRKALKRAGAFNPRTQKVRETDSAASEL